MPVVKNLSKHLNRLILKDVVTDFHHLMLLIVSKIHLLAFLDVWNDLGWDVADIVAHI